MTVFVCSAENLQRRGAAEITFLIQVIEDVVADRLARLLQELLPDEERVRGRNHPITLGTRNHIQQLKQRRS